MTFSLSSAATNITSNTELSSPVKGGSTKADSSLTSAANNPDRQAETGLFAQFFAQFSDGNKDPATRSAAASGREQDTTRMLIAPDKATAVDSAELVAVSGSQDAVADEISIASAASLVKSVDVMSTGALTEMAVTESVLNANGSQASASSFNANSLTADKMADRHGQIAGANTESNDALLARLGQSAMLLQKSTKGGADSDFAGAPVMTDNALADMALSDSRDNNDEDNSDLVAGMISWDLAAKPTASVTIAAVPADADTDTPGQASASQGAATTINQAASSASDNGFYTELSSADLHETVTSEKVETPIPEKVETLTTEKVETLDFNQIMESACKSEALDPTPRGQVKAQPLSDVDQQLLDKHVNLHNSSASSELHEKISLMAGKDLHTATIRLDPAELGSLHIKLVLQNDQVNVTIQAQNGHSRDLLEQQLPRLRELLQQQGINLADSQVQADSGGQQQSAFKQQSAFQQHGKGREQAGMNSSQSAGAVSSTDASQGSSLETAVTSQYWQGSGKGVDFYA